MIFLYGFFLTILLILIGLLSVPVKIRLESSMLVCVQWVFLRFRITLESGSMSTELRLFNRQLKKRKKSDPEAPSPPRKSKKGTKPKKKVPFSFVKETLQDVAVRKLLRQLLLLIQRLMTAVRIRLLHWNIGLRDYYWQGIVYGLVSGLPDTKHLQIRGNFQETNDFLLVAHVSIWRILGAILIFLLCFPYYRAVRIYFRYRAVT